MSRKLRYIVGREEELHACGRFVAIKRLTVEETTSAGLVLPKNRLDQNIFARVISIGKGVVLPDGHFTDPPPIKPGDICAVRQFEGHKILPNDHSVRICDWMHVEGIASTEPFNAK